MTFYEDFDYSKIENCPVFSAGRVYDNNIYTFDIETTSVFSRDGQTFLFDASKKPDYYKDCDKCGFMYIWQFSINSDVVYGRTWEQFTDFLTALKNNILGELIIYVHNLAFEFQFLRNVITDFEVFARSPRHVIVARSAAFNVEFRCSLMLTNAALAAVPKIYNLPVEKMTGDLDYNQIRLSTTPLTDKELKYCEHDCLVVYELIKKMRGEYGKVKSIPLTATGILRRQFQQIYKNDKKYKKWLNQQLTVDIDSFVFQMRAFSGGYTHANSYYTGEIMRNVHSYDITSSYPTVMIAEQYPVTRFCDCATRDLDMLDEQHCWIVDITFTDIYSLFENNYLSLSKSIDRYHALTDNGRVVKADSIRYILTDVDMDVIKKCYRWGGYVINRVQRAEKGYLDKKLIEKILELYNGKTKFKGLTDFENEYLHAKQGINSVYGMCVTNLITDGVLYTDSNGWTIEPLTSEAAQEKLTAIFNNRNTFLSQAWGVYVTAYARRNLWSMIMQIDADVIYCDTDSIKYVGDHDDLFNIYNVDIMDKLKKACEHHGIQADLLNPKDSKGVRHPLGVFDRESDYSSFVTLGAKKYAFKHTGGNIEITLSGVKKSGASALKSLHDFKKGFTFDYDHSGKKILTYNDDQEMITVTDAGGREDRIDYKYGINLMPTEYTIGMSDDYMSFINDTLHYSEAEL